MGNPRAPPPPPPPEKPGLLSAIFGFSKQKTPGYSRRNDPIHNRRNKINRRIDVGRLNLNTRRCENIFVKIPFKICSSELKTPYPVNPFPPGKY